MGLVIRNGTLAQLSPRIVRRSDILIEGDVVSAIGSDIPSGDHIVLDVDGALVMPGNVCGHTHLYSALARGMPAPRKNPRNFPEILEYIWWPLDRALDEASIRSSGLIGSIDAIKAGTTTLVDHHASPNCIEGSLDVLAEEMSRAGVRGILCYEVTDRNGTEGRRLGIAENERFAREVSRKWPLMRAMFGAHASFTLDDDSLEAIAGSATDLNIGVHIHVAEDTSDQVDSMERCGQRVGFRLDSKGILSSRSLAAHGVHLDSDEIDLLRARRSWLAHNCRSNLNNSVGRAPVPGMIRELKDKVVLGTDGIDGDMFSESRSAYFRAREDSLNAFAEQFTDMLSAGTQLVSEYFGRPLGRLEPGYLADLVVYDYTPPTPLTADNLAWHWMFAFTNALVRDVMVGGKWVLRDRSMVNLDGGAARAMARTQAAQLWKRMEELPA